LLNGNNSYLHRVYAVCVSQHRYSATQDIRSLTLNKQLAPYTSPNCQSLGQLFVGFLHYFAHDFKLATQTCLSSIVLCYYDGCCRAVGWTWWLFSRLWIQLQTSLGLASVRD